MEAAFFLVVWTHGYASPHVCPFAIRHSPLVTRHSPFATRHSIMMITLALQNRVCTIQLLHKQQANHLMRVGHFRE